MYKKKMLLEVPRRSSDRLALKALQKEEGERQEALEREKQREEQRKFEAEEAARKEEEAIRRRERQREEAIKRRRGKKFIWAESESACLLALTHTKDNGLSLLQEQLTLFTLVSICIHVHVYTSPSHLRGGIFCPSAWLSSVA